MKQYEIEGHYTGKVILRVKAASHEDALMRFQDADEDDVDILHPEDIKIDEKTLREK